MNWRYKHSSSLPTSSPGTLFRNNLAGNDREASIAGYYISLYMADNNILSPVQCSEVSVNILCSNQSTFCLEHSSILIFLTIWRQVMLKHYKRALQLCLCIKFFWWVFPSLTFSERGATQNLIVYLLSLGLFKGNV